METLLKPGDMIRIREDIKQSETYRMLNDDKISNTWIEDDMLPPGTLVEITNVSNGQYTVRHFDKLDRNPKYFEEDDFWLYTDQMFDPEIIACLLEERYQYYNYYL